MCKQTPISSSISIITTILNILLHFYSVERLPEALEVIEEKASSDPVHRKVFVRGLHYDTQKSDLEEAFAGCS